MSEIINTATILVVADSSGVEAGMRQVDAAVVRTGRNLDNLGRTDGLRQIGNGASQSAGQIEAASRRIGTSATSAGQSLNALGQSPGLQTLAQGADSSSRRVEIAQRNLIGSIQRTTAALEAGSRTGAAYYETLARQRGVDPNVLAPYLAQLRAVEVAQGRATASLNQAAPALGNVGISAAQTAAALRGVPAQFTDIATSIAGGQKPLTVLLQQGGQLKDMFGGAGNAARALGGYVVGLLTPVTLVAGAVVALSYAYSEGAAESRAYTAALISSGNAAGTSADQLAKVSRAIAATVGTQGDAAAALVALTATGKVSAQNMEQFGLVAVKAQRALGQSVADTAAEFAELGKTPVQALEKLNEKYHFLTGSVYEHVKALDMQGRGYEAGTAAQQAFAVAFDGVTTKVDANLGILQKGWRGLSDVAKSAWDSMLNIGRQDSLEDQLTKVREKIAKASRPFDAGFGGNAESKAQLQANLDIEASLKRQISARDHDAQFAADNARFNAADLEWSRGKFQFLTRQQQLNFELDAERQKGLDAGISDIDINTRLMAVRLKYSDIYNAGIDSNIEALKRRDSLEQVLSTRSLAQIAAARAQGAISEDDAINRTAKAELARFDQSKKLLEQELALAKQKQLSQKEQAELEGQIAVVSANRTSREIQLENDLFAIEQKRTRLAADNFANRVDSLRADAVQYDKDTLAQKDYNEAIGLTKLQLASVTSARLLDLAARKESDASIAEGLDLTGQLADAYRDQAAAIRERAAAILAGAGKEQRFDEWKKNVDTYGDIFRTGFADMLNSGSAGWRSFTKSLVTTFKTTVADQIYKMFAKPLVVQLVGSFLGIDQASIATAIAGDKGVGAPAAGGSGGVSAVAGIASSAKSAYDAISKGFSGLGSTIGSTLSSLGNSVGSNTLYSFGQGMQGFSAGGAGSGISGNAAGYGQVAGTAASYLGGAAVGVYGGRAISGGYSVLGGQTGNTAVNTGTIVGAIVGGPIGAAIGGLIGGAANRLFGLKAKEITSTTLNGAFGAGGFSGTSDSAFIQKGGLFRSDKRGVDKVAIDAATAKSFTAGYDALKAASTDFASVLGINADSIKNRSQSVSIALGKDQAENDKAIAAFFTGVADQIAKELVPSLSDLAKEGEAASTTLQRIAGDYAFVDAALSAMGKEFGAVGIGSVSARERLIDLSGGIDALGKGAAYFAQNFLSDAERMIPVAKTVEAALAGLGLSRVTTRDQFKEVVLGLDLTSESGAKTYSTLIGIAEKFASLHPVVDKVAVAVENTTDAMVGAVSAARESQAKIMSSIGSAVADSLNRTLEAAKSLRAYSDSLLTGSLSALSAEERYQAARKQFQDADPTDTTAANNYLQAAKDRDAGDFSYSRDFAAVMEKIGKGATGLDERAGGLKNLWRSYADERPYRDPETLVAPAGLGALTSAVPIDPSEIIKELQLMREAFQQALKPVAESTAAAADYLDRVTSGGTAMVVES